MHTGEKIPSYLNTVELHAGTMKSMNCIFNDNEIGKTTLNGLHSSYEHFIFAVDALFNDDKHFTFDSVKSRLLQEEQGSAMHEGRSFKNMEYSSLMSGVFPSIDSH